MKERTVLTLVVVCLVAMSGCLGASNGGQTTETTTTTATPAADVDVEEIRDEAVAAMAEVDTYRVEGDQTATVVGDVQQEVHSETSATFDRRERQLRQEETTTAMGQTQRATTYLVDRTMYVESDAFVQTHSSRWVKLNLSELDDARMGENFSAVWDLLDTLERQRELLEVATVEYLGTETVEGTETQVLAADVNESQYEQIAEGLLGRPLSSGGSYEVNDVAFQYWIDTDTRLPVRSQGHVNFTFSTGGQELTQNMTMTLAFRDYDEPVEIALPEASENAVPLYDTGETGPRVPQVALDFEYDPDDGTVTIVHEGGDAIDDANTDRLEVHVLPEGDVSEWDLPVRAGDQTSVAVSAGDRVEVRWVGPDGGVRVLAEFRVPDDE